MKVSNKRSSKISSMISILFSIFVAFILNYIKNECNAEFVGKFKENEFFSKNQEFTQKENNFSDKAMIKNNDFSELHQHKDITDSESKNDARRKLLHMIDFRRKSSYEPKSLNINFLCPISTVAQRRLLAKNEKKSEKEPVTQLEEKQKQVVEKNHKKEIFDGKNQNDFDRDDGDDAAANQKNKVEMYVELGDQTKTEMSKKLKLKMQEDFSHEWQEALRKCHMWLSFMQADGRCREALQRLIGDKLYSTVYGLCDVPIVLSHSSIKLLKKAFKEKADVYLRFYPAITMVVEYDDKIMEEEEEENLFLPENEIKSKNDTKPENPSNKIL